MKFAVRNVVLATGAFPKAKLPPASAALSTDLCQLHTSEYRNPQTLPSGAVLVVGTGQSGCQIAEELQESGRQDTCLPQAVEESLAATEAKTAPGGSSG